MLLKEISKEPQHPGFLTDRDEIYDWLIKMNIDGVHINEDSTVDVHGDVYLNSKQLMYIPVQFRRVTGLFSIAANKLRSLKGCPQIVGAHFSCRQNRSLTSLEFAPKEVGWKFDAVNTKVTSLVGISNICEKITQQFLIDQRAVTRGGIGLIFIKECTLKDSYTEPFQIIERYMRRPQDLYECQAELIDAGFEDYAII